MAVNVAIGGFALVASSGPWLWILKQEEVVVQEVEVAVVHGVVRVEEEVAGSAS